MKLQKLLLPMALSFSTVAFGASDGTLGSDSTGTTDVSVTIGDLVQVSVEQDVGLTHTTGSNSNGSTGVCVYRNSDADVAVTLTSANATGTTFRMADGTNYIPYAVDFDGARDSGTQFIVSDENNTSSNCGGVYSHSLDVQALAADLDAAGAGTYLDTITILVEPN